jgi:endonuclease YncB( thermonuclease family)
MRTIVEIAGVLLSALAALAPPSYAQAPPSLEKKIAPFTGTISRVLDGDTYIVKRADGTEQKIRLHYGDAPEIAHNSKEKDQPHARDAMAYVKNTWQGHKVKVTPRGTSYDRIVADVDLDHAEWDKPNHSAPCVDSLVINIVADGYAMLDPRFHPPDILLDNEQLAKLNKKGIWADPTKPPTPPWEWRKKKHLPETKWAFKSFGIHTSLEDGPLGDCDHPLGTTKETQPKGPPKKLETK